MWFNSALAALMVAIVVHYVTGRYIASGALARFIVIGCLAGVGLMAWLYRAYGWEIEAVAAILVYAFACELYIFLFTFASFSVSANLLSRLSREAMTSDQIDQLYGSRQMVQMRIDRAIAKGLIVVDGDRVHLTIAGRQLVIVFNFLRACFRHPL
jgi:hypothetical protein